jgi:hypothetical protein
VTLEVYYWLHNLLERGAPFVEKILDNDR